MVGTIAKATPLNNNNRHTSCHCTHIYMYQLLFCLEYVWSQEEPVNNGPWTFIAPRLRKQLGINVSCESWSSVMSAAAGSECLLLNLN